MNQLTYRLWLLRNGSYRPWGSVYDCREAQVWRNLLRAFGHDARIETRGA